MTIQHNIVHDMMAGPGGVGDGGGIDIDVNTAGCVSQYNYAYNCEGAGLVTYTNSHSTGTTPNTFRFNLAVNCATVHNAGLWFDGYGSPNGTLAYNNTVVCCGAYPAAGFYGAPASVGCKVYNNLLISRAGIPAVSSANAFDATCAMDYNVYMAGNGATPTFSANGTTYTGLAAWRSGVVQDAHSSAISQSPFAYVLPANSTATPGVVASLSQYCPVPGAAGTTVMTGGTNLSTTYSINPGTADFLGNTLPGSPAFAGCMSVSGSAPNNYEATVYGLDPIITYRLSESSGTNAYDNALSTGAAALTSVTLGGTSLATSDGGTTAVFNGTSSVATSPVLAYTYTLSAFSLEAWILPTTVAPANSNIVCFMNSTVNSCNLLLNNSLLGFLIKDTSSVVVQAHPTSYTVSANVPIHVVCVWPGGNTLLIYVNGVSQAVSYDNTGSPSSFQFYQMLIGNQSGFSRFYAGNAGPINVYPAALTGPQVANLYCQGIPAVLSPRMGCGAALMGCF